MKIAFEEFGSGKPIIFLHAFPLSRKMWKPQIEFLTANKYHVILPDLRGFGESHNFADINSMKDIADDIGELLTTLKIERAIIVGLSMGGYVLFNLLNRMPEKFAAIVLCGTNSSADSETKRESRFDLIEKIEQKGVQALIDDFLPKTISDYTLENKPELVKLIEQMVSEVNPQAAIAAIRGMAAREDYTASLADISLPTLLISGEDDKISNLNIAKQLQKQITNSKLVVIESAGHYLNLEQPEQFNNNLIDFAKEHCFVKNDAGKTYLHHQLA